MNNSFFSLPRIDKKLIPWATVTLIAINVVVFLYMEAAGDTLDTDYMLSMGASYAPYVVEGHQYYRLFTYMFLHYGFDHLFNNMISLAVLGYSLEHVMGRARFVTVYMLSGILAGVASVLYNLQTTDGSSVSAGASGAIFGLLGALLVMMIRANHGHINKNMAPFLLYLALTMYSGYLDQTIDDVAHAGGFVAGLAIAAVIQLIDKRGNKS